MKKINIRRIAGFGMALLGFSMLIWIALPFISYEVKSKSDFATYLSPVPDTASVDYTQVNSWFPGSNLSDTGNSLVRFYNVTIPRLGIDGAVVSVGGEDLADSLIQYPGTALPGKVGNTVVFGHSVLPTFFDPKVYLTMFSTLPTMKKNDLVKLDYDGISYEYRVSDMYEVFPTDLSVLEQNTDSSVLSLVTCVPPGDPRRPKRLVVKAKLVPPSEKVKAI